MRVWFVAIGAEIVRNRSFEIAVCVTLHTANLQVLSDQRKLRRRVIESDREGGLLPGGRVVTRVASLFECALMRVDTVAV